jgi:hypothetical protein
MANTQKEKQRQFGFKLLIIALIVAVFFSIWYWLEKIGKFTSFNRNETPQTTER